MKVFIFTRKKKKDEGINMTDLDTIILSVFKNKTWL